MAVFLEFDKVKTVKIPEGNVHKITIGGQLLWQYRYTWAKYTSARTGYAYNNYVTNSASQKIDIYIRRLSPIDGVLEITDDSTDIDGHIYYDFIYYTSFSYSKSSGTFTVSGKSRMGISTFMGWSNYTIESSLIGKYVQMDGKVYKITDHDDTNYLILGETYSRGSMYYKYSYSYVGDVRSTNKNAYTSGSISNYTSTSGTDTRTAYVFKG